MEINMSGEKMELESFERRALPLGVLGLKVSQNDTIRAYQLWDDECRRNVYSASKSFTSTAVGIAAREGLLSLDESLTEVFAQELPEAVNENLRKARVRDLLTMCLGQEQGNLMGGQRPFYEEDDWVKLSLAFPFVYEPGTHFVYNNVGPYLAGVLVQRRAGCDLVSYLQPRLFTPLGIKRPTWESDPLGYTFGAGGLFLNLSELHKLGLLYLHGGEWNGRQLVPREWVDACSRPQSDSGYSYLFWMGRNGTYRADGKYCQWCIIAPEKQAVITVTAECRRADELKSAVFEELWPQL